LLDLRWDSRVDQTEIGVEVDNGVVTLTGTVNCYAKKLAAKEAAHRVVGVLDVADNVQVKLPGSLKRSDTEIAQAVRCALADPAQLRKSIEEALERRAEREAEKIRVKVEDGTVVLEGRVRTWPEREAVLDTVSHAPGVREVRDRLTVNPWA
jgi:osmotically-inducible protein OsmY